jgi:hypothetical protein
MKKLSKYFMVATVSLSMVMHNAFAAATEQSGVCALIEGLSPVIKTLRTLAFIGAAFVLMDWAWDWIQKGTVEKKDVKDKGVALLVGFFVLFGVGIVLSFVVSQSGMDYLGCVKNAFNAK